MEAISLKRQREEVDETSTTTSIQTENQTVKIVDGEVEEVYKKQKSYIDILSILEEDEDEPNEDISSLITTLQQEISPSLTPASSSSSSPTSSCSESSLLCDNQLPTTDTTITATRVAAPEINSVPTAAQAQPESSTLEHCNSFSSTGEVEYEEEEEGEKVMRHLLEASDDELGIPNNDIVSSGEDEGKIGKDEFLIGEELLDGFGGAVNGGDFFDFGNEMWEFEDETANYYAMLQSELFMGAVDGVM